MTRILMATVASLLWTGVASAQPTAPGGSAAVPATQTVAGKPLPRRAGPRVRRRDNLFGLPLLALAFAGAGGAAAAASSGNAGPASPS